MGNKRLHIVHTESSCGWGGQEIRIIHESLGMIALGHMVTIVCVQGSNIYRESLASGINTIALPIAKKRVLGLLSLKRWLSDIKVDVVNTHSSTDAWLVALARVFLSKKLNVIRTRHVSAPINANFATRWLYRGGCDFVVTTGERLREHVLEKINLPPDRVLSVPTGVDIERFAPGDKQVAREYCDLPSNARIVGIVATLRSWKGHVYLIEALARAKKKDLYLLIVGDGPNRPKIDEVIEKRGVEDHVIFAGQQKDVVPWLRSMDLFVLPSYANEGVPQSLMQAMACGIPVVSTPVGSVDELIISNQTGVLVAPKSIRELTEQLSNDYLCNGQVDNARKHIEENFSYKSMCSNMSRIFREISSEG